ncbi:pupal cuticle protein Edg-78E-like [Musca vetustissima]|uniref:pupal cuticle protein Edg-78E-like n=1 Tax=Musca vetustissima TaxID=27455 RepID=UPI002AB65F63|nr:pupal cuticle protein Edg-78E-like [Musca vetustissima]
MAKLFICCLAALCAVAVARPDQYDAAAETRSFSADIKEDGSYQYQFDTTNGIAAQESGVGGYYASGSSAYYAPDGQLITLTYTADENGFQPSGDHLPTPPPIPNAILKSLEYIRTHPHQEERQGGAQVKPFKPGQIYYNKN